MKLRHPEEIINIVIPGEPVPWGRPRVMLRPGQNPVFFQEGKTKQAKEDLRNAIRAAFIMGEPTEAAIAIELNFACGKIGRQLPDIDNLAKTVLDAMNNFVWRDDAQVLSLYVTVERNDPNPRSHMIIWADTANPDGA